MNNAEQRDRIKKTSENKQRENEVFEKNVESEVVKQAEKQEEYDPMKALLEHQSKQDKKTYEPLRHISLTETGKFSVRH